MGGGFGGLEKCDAGMCATKPTAALEMFQRAGSTMLKPVADAAQRVEQPATCALPSGQHGQFCLSCPALGQSALWCEEEEEGTEPKTDGPAIACSANSVSSKTAMSWRLMEVILRRV